MRVILFSILLGTFLLTGCGEDPEHKILHEAHDIHMEAFKIKKDLESQLAQLVQKSNSIQVQGRPLTEEEIKFTEQVDNISQKLKYWDENHIEVPGFSHEGHDHSGHDHDHSHDHGSQFNLPASDVLIIQKEFKDSIVILQQQIQNLLEK